MRTWILTAVLALGLAAPGSAFARIYKWVDDEGNVQYTQTPPADRPAETVVTHIPKQVPPAQHPAEGSDQQSAEGGSSGQAQAAADQKEQMKRNCEIARQNAKLLESGIRVKVKDDDGNTAVLDDQQKAAKLAETKKQVELFCNDNN